MLRSVQELRMVQSCVMCCVVCRSSGWCSVVQCAGVLDSAELCDVQCAGVQDGAELCDVQRAGILDGAVCRSSGQCRVV